jgi:hypothetical protein
MKNNNKNRYSGYPSTREVNTNINSDNLYGTQIGKS